MMLVLCVLKQQFIQLINGTSQRNNIKNQRYYFFDDTIDIKIFHSNLLEIGKKSHKDISIYYIGYITIRTFSDCGNISGVNPLYLIIYSATGYSKEKDGEKILNY